MTLNQRSTMALTLTKKKLSNITVGVTERSVFVPYPLTFSRHDDSSVYARVPGQPNCWYTGQTVNKRVVISGASSWR